MMLYRKERLENGQRNIYLFGIKVFSYSPKQRGPTFYWKGVWKEYTLENNVLALEEALVDFFEIKPMLEELRPDYKFMIRRSEAVFPLADIVLIAY